MVAFNLLPWRIYDKAYQQRTVKKIMIISCIAAIVLIIATHYFLSFRNQQLSVVILSFSSTQKQMEEQHINPLSIPTIYTAWQSHLVAQRLFVNLFSQPKEAICLTGLTRANDQVTLQGQTMTIDMLAQFLQAATLFNLFTEIKISEVNKEMNAVHFKLIGTL